MILRSRCSRFRNKKTDKIKGTDLVIDVYQLYVVYKYKFRVQILIVQNSRIVYGPYPVSIKIIDLECF